MERPQDVSSRILTELGPGMAHCVLRALADDFSARIMSSAVLAPVTVEEISQAQQIPLSTCYRRTRGLVDSGLVLVERIIITASGKRSALYRSCFRSFRISSALSGVTVEAEVNQDVADKVRAQRLSLAYALPLEVNGA